jgi:glucan 1,4-alpha-glucosidase
MMVQRQLILIIIAMTMIMQGCNNELTTRVSSPSGNIRVEVLLLEGGKPAYRVWHKGELVIDASPLGFDFLDAQPMAEGFEIQRSRLRSFHEMWEMPWGEQRTVLSNYNELSLHLREQNQPGRQMNLVFRVFDNGLGFRIEFPEQPNMKQVYITEENTWFRFTGDHLAWWRPGDWDIHEHLYNTTRISQINALEHRDHPNLAQTYIPVNAVNTPITMRTDDGLYLSFHEAALIDYAGITLELIENEIAFKTHLVGSSRDYKVERNTPFHTPWRTIQIAERAGDLIESKMLLNLNEPNKLGDVSWAKPAKYAGIWWEMHINKSTWDYASGRHGATTENAMRYIDFAAENNIDAVLIEGWNTGWENWIGTPEREGIFDFVTPYPDYDLHAVVDYANQRGVKIVMHHETSADVRTYDNQLDTAYALIESLGINHVKTGYVGTIIPEGEYHHNQWMVNHYIRVLETAARHRAAINSHETVMVTGLRRTYPNWMTSENLRGQEFNAWATDGGNPTEHLTIIPFTRMLAGPIDYTPGIFNIKIDPYRPENQVNNTIANQLAIYVVIYSPLQMIADLPEHYENHPAFQFIRDVGVDWERSVVLNGEPGEFITIAREERNTRNWFLGSITNAEARSFNISTDFLAPGRSYLATIYADAPDAHWDTNPTAYRIDQTEVDSTSVLTLELAPGGGTAISFHLLE